MTHKESLSKAVMDIMKGANPDCEGVLQATKQTFALPCPACRVEHFVAVMICQTCQQAILVVDGTAHDHNQIVQDLETMHRRVHAMQARDMQRRIRRHIFN